VKKVNKKSPALRENSPALLCIFFGQTAHSPPHYTRNAPITKIGNPLTFVSDLVKGHYFLNFLRRLGLGVIKKFGGRL